MNEGSRIEEESKTTEPHQIERLDRYINRIDEILSNCERKDKFIAIGECGLDYDRFEYADKETQLL